MSTRFFAAALIALSTAVAAPAFASGYGPAPSYRPDTGAPSSQSGPNAATLRADNHAAANANASNDAMGGVRDSSSQAGARVQFGSSHTIFAHH
jgi:hypothetical protein